MSETAIECSVEGCGESVYAKLLCHPHYDKNRMYGNPTHQPSKRVPVECSVTGCDRVAVSRAYCEKHYSRWKRHKSPDDLEPRNCEECGDLFDPPGVRSKICKKAECVRARKIKKNARSLKNRPRPIQTRECVGCGKEFETKTHAKFCSRRCPGRPDPNLNPLKEAIASSDYPSIIRLLQERTAPGSNGCWVWRGTYTTGYEYPQVGFSKVPAGMKKTYSAHRLMLEAKLKQPLGKMQAHHECANSSCINPEHLSLASASENVGEMMARKTYEARINALEAEVMELRTALAEHDPEHPLVR